jgi:hypothetical protein
MSVTIKGSGQVPVQTVQTFATNNFTVSATSMTTITGVTVTITPTNTSNKVLVNISLVWSAPTAGYDHAFQLLRNGTPVGIGTLGTTGPNYSFMQVQGGGNQQQTTNWQYLDSPATTSACVYTVQVRTQSGGGAFTLNNSAAFLNGGTDVYQGGYGSSITAQEIAYA